ncbi:MAG: DUF4349 domain-containing protein [Roseiflexus sp.]
MALITRLILSIAGALVLVACGVASVAPREEGIVSVPTPAALGGAPALERNSGTEDQQIPSSNPSASDRLIIKNASVELEVSSVAEAEASIRQKAEQLGGFVVSVQTYGSGDTMMSTIVIRVPAMRFEEALSGIEGLAKKVLSRNVSGDDVTEEYVDLESQLRNLEATQKRLLELLARAEKVEDALQVNQALTDIQGQIEQIKGRMQYLERSAAMSTITAALRPVPPPPSIIEEDGWQPINVARESLRGLIEFGQELVNLLIVLGIWAPVWLPVVLFGRWGWRKIVRGGKKSEQSTLPAPPPSAPQPPSGKETGSGTSR